LAEFEVAMMERELKVKELDKERLKYMAPKRREYRLPYVLTDEQLKLASERFPRTLFRATMDNSHDHPLAHLETMIASDRAVRMIEGGAAVIDVYGSPKRVEDLNRGQRRSNNPKHFFALVKQVVEKDALRASNWGTGPNYFDMEGFSLTEVLHGIGLDEGTWFFLCHTLYYLSDDEIFDMLTSVRGAKALAIVHRHPGESGTMFAGETTYAKVQGCVEQVNVATGERYTHRDLDYLFKSTTKVAYTTRGAFTWTMHMVTKETWIVELVACSDTLNERFLSRVASLGRQGAVGELNEHALRPSKFQHPALATLPGASCTMVGGLPLVSFADHGVSVNVTCPELVEFLRLSIMGKPRNPVTLQDTFALARTHVAGGSEFAGKKNFRCKPDELPGHVLLAYLSGLRDESNVLKSLALYRNYTKEHHALLDFDTLAVPGSGAVHAALSVAAKVNRARRDGDVVGSVIQALR
jgi:hypothetical protein